MIHKKRIIFWEILFISMKIRFILAVWNIELQVIKIITKE